MKKIIPIISTVFVLGISTVLNGCIHKKELEMINKNDFSVCYNDFEVSYDTEFSDILDEFGYGNAEEHEGNNYGYISGCPEARRFVVKYPDYQNTEISLICIENYTTGEIFIERVRLDDAETQRGLRVGDKKEDIFELYGENYRKELNDSDLCSYIYSDSEGHSLRFTVYEISNTITDILLEYNTDSYESLMIENYQNAIINEPVNEPEKELTYKIVPATEQEIEEIGDRLLAILGMYQKDYNYSCDSIYDDMFSYNILEYIYPDYDEEVEKYIAEPLYKDERGRVRWSKLIYENDPLGKFPPIPKELYNEDGEVDEKLAYGLPDDFKWTDMVLGYNKYSGEYIDWLVEGVWNGKADHDTFFKFEDGTLCYYYDGYYYTPELAGDRGGGIFFGPVVQYVSPIEDNKYSVGYLIVDEVDEPVGSGTAVLGMKETKNGFRFWSIFSIDYDTEIPKG